MLLVVFFTVNYQSLFLRLDFDPYAGKLYNKKIDNFSLLDVSGKTFTLKDFKGSYTYLFFGFSKCDGVCPINMAKFSKLSKSFLALKTRPRFAFVSIDTIRDNRDNVRDFVNSYGKNIIGLLSGKDNTIKVAENFYSYINLDEEELIKNENAQIQHAGNIYLLSPDKKLSLIYLAKDVDIKSIVQDYKLLLSNERNKK